MAESRVLLGRFKVAAMNDIEYTYLCARADYCKYQCDACQDALDMSNNCPAGSTILCQTFREVYSSGEGGCGELHILYHYLSDADKLYSDNL